MYKLAIEKLNPVQLSALREMALIGKLPRLMTLAKLVQLGFLEPGTFEIRPGVHKELLGKEKVDPEEILKALRARKDSPIQ